MESDNCLQATDVLKAIVLAEIFLKVISISCDISIPANNSNGGRFAPIELYHLGEECRLTEMGLR